jgi:hypothetical protein
MPEFPASRTVVIPASRSWRAMAAPRRTPRRGILDRHVAHEIRAVEEPRLVVLEQVAVSVDEARAAA